MDGWMMDGRIKGWTDAWMHGFDKAIRILGSKHLTPIETENKYP